jgi:hypothetical protein
MTDPLDRLKTALADRYTIERELGRGGMAVVYLARDRQLDRSVAIKVLRPELSESLGRDRFLREIRIEANLQHPNVLPIFDSGEADGLLYYTMPYVEGESLRVRLQREGQLPIDEALRITREVAEALAHAHAHRIVHRDIKPGNILLSSRHAVVADFGIARAFTAAGAEPLTKDTATAGTPTGMAIGTPEYMSPEQVAGDGAIDGRSDQYALACVVFEMLAGDPPFTGRTMQSVIGRQLTEPPPSLEHRRSKAPRNVTEAVDKALSKVPADRYPTIEAFVDRLETPDREPRFTALQRLALALLATLAAVLAAAVAGMLLWPGTGPALDHNRVVVFPLVTPDDSLNAAGAGWDVALAIGGALEHTQPLKWIDGWSHLGEAERSNVRLVTPELAASISRERGARYYVDGVIRHTGRQTAVVLRLHDVVGDSMVAQETAAAANVGELPTLALQAVTRILPALLQPGQPVDLSPLTDRSPGANALAIQGDRAYRRADFQTALEFYRRAVAEDSLHVFAAVKGAQAANWLNRPEESRDLIRRGLAHVEFLPLRYQLYARGLSAVFDGWADSAVAYYGSALDVDDQWAEAWMALGETYYHLLPDAAAPLDSLAEAAFWTAHGIDTTFSPPLLHLAEIAIRRGDVEWGAEALDRLAVVKADTTLARRLSLMVDCVRDPSRPFDWRGAVAGNPAAVDLAGENLSVAMAQPACALGAFQAVLGRPELPAGYKWSARVGVHGLLVAERRYDEALAVIDSSLASGMRSAYFLYVLGALAGAPFDAGAEQAERVARQGAGEYYERAGPETQWMFAVWHGRHGRIDKLVRIAENLRAQGEGDLKAALFARALDAHVALARGDTMRSLELLEGLRSVGTDNEILWSAGLSLAPERHLLAELQLARGLYREAYLSASVFDHPNAIMFLPYVPRSLEIRVEAAEAIGHRELARTLRRRLQSFGGPRQASATTN